MHNSYLSPYFKSESHQMKLALSLWRQILLVFLPGRKRKPFHTVSLIQNSKNLPSLLLKGKAVQGLGREDDHSSFQEHSLPSPLHPVVLGFPISKEINDAYFIQRVHVYRTMGLGSSVTESPWNKAKVWAWPPHGRIFICFTALTLSLTLSGTLQMHAI